MRVLKTFSRHLVGVALMCLATAGAARAASIHLVASSDAINVGDVVTISLEISGLGAGPGDSLGAFDVDVRFDQNLLQLTSFSFVDPILGSNPLDLLEVGSLPFLGDALVNGGVLDAFGVSGNSADVLDRAQVGAFRFFSANFVALGPGLASVMLDLLDPQLVFAGGGAELGVQFEVSASGVRIAAHSVPEPSAAGCLGLACIGLLLCRVRLRGRVLGLIVALASLPTFASAQTSSPFKPDPEALGRYVVNGGPGLDTGCTFRNAGPLIINLKVPATMNPQAGLDEDGEPILRLDSTGKLLDAQRLIANRVIDKSATLRFPVFDIDSSAMETGFAPEVDEVRFNGRLIKRLSGKNNEWTDDTMQIPIEDVRFTSEFSPNATNELRIDIDVENKASGREVWCMAVDWLAVEFGAALPYVLVHGIAAAADTWNEEQAPGVLAALDRRGVLHTEVTLGRNESTSNNAVLLEAAIETFLEATKTKSDRVHVIAHSKGGLDTQRMVALAPKPKFTVLTLSTLSTPHLGSVAADLALISMLPGFPVNRDRDPRGFAAEYLSLSSALNFANAGISAINALPLIPNANPMGPRRPGLDDLAVDKAVSDRMAKLRGNIPLTFTISADADLNQNGDLTSDEVTPLFGKTRGFEFLFRPGRAAWRVLRDFSAARFVRFQSLAGQFPVATLLVYDTDQNINRESNDIVVTEKSAMPNYGIGVGSLLANHSTVKNEAAIEAVLELSLIFR